MRRFRLRPPPAALKLRWRRALPLCTQTSAASGEGATLVVSEACARRLREISAKNGRETALRVAVDSGGCSGFQYSFQLEEGGGEGARSEDRVFERDGSRVLVDEVSLDFLRGATVDYETEMIRSSFAIKDNPNADNACGCGVSFAAK